MNAPFGQKYPLTFDDVMRGSKRRRFDNRCLYRVGPQHVKKILSSSRVTTVV